MKKRLIAMILCAVMLLSVLPLGASAGGTEITAVIIGNVPAPLGGNLMVFNDNLLLPYEPDLYTAYFWEKSWRNADGYFAPEDGATFVGGDRYTLSLAIIPQDGATGLDAASAADLPVYFNGMRAIYDPTAKPDIPDEPGKEAFVYEVEMESAMTDTTIRVISVDGVLPPATGAEPCSAADLSVPDGAPYSIKKVKWIKYLGDPDPETSFVQEMALADLFEDGKWYYIDLVLVPAEGYAFAEKCTVRINGGTELADTEFSRKEGASYRLFSTNLKAEARHIDEIKIDGLRTFYVGDTAITALENATVPAGAGYSLNFTPGFNVARKTGDEYVNDDTIITAGESYAACFRVVPAPGWTIDSATVWSINGRADIIGMFAESIYGYWYVWTVYQPAVEKTVITDVAIYGCMTPDAGDAAGDDTHTYLNVCPYLLTDHYWLCDTDHHEMADDATFEAGKFYSMCNVVTPLEGFVFAADPSFTLNDGEFNVAMYGQKADGVSYYVWTEQMESFQHYIVWWYLDPADEDPVTGVDVIAGDTFPAPAAPVKDGYTFGGWCTDKECTTFYDDTTPIMAETSLYPLWLTNVTAIDAAITAPAVGEAPASACTLTTTPAGLNVQEDVLIWVYWDEEHAAWQTITDPSYVFEEDVIYGVDIYVSTGEKVIFVPEITGSVNGKPSDESSGPVFKDSDHVYLSYNWDPLCLHAETEVKDAAEATCLTDGYTGDTYCKKCGEKIAEGTVIPALGHDLVEEAAVAATCTAPGKTAGEHCTRCDYKKEQEEVPALGHDFKDGVCTRCGEKDPDAKPCDGGENCPSKAFTDVNAGDWYHLAVDFAVSKGLFNGMSETTFEPNTPMSRAMLVTVLWRYEGKPMEGTNDFTDVPAGQWYTDAVAWAAKNGIVNGVGDGKFDPDGKITREQLAAILFRYSGNKGYDVSKRDDFAGFPDKAAVSSWATDAYGWAVAEKLITGNDGRLDPQGNATRAQVATILMRFIQNIAK